MSERKQKYECLHPVFGHCLRDDHDACIDAKVAADGIPRCHMCGETIEDCDKTTDAEGFNECEWLAEK